MNRVIIFIILSCLSVINLSAQQCVDQVRQDFSDCVQSATLTCSAASGELCDLQDAENIFIANAVISRAKQVCCALPLQQLQLECYGKAISATRKARPLFDSATITAVLLELRRQRRLIRDSNECS